MRKFDRAQAAIVVPTRLCRRHTARLLDGAATAVDLIAAGLSGEKSAASDPAAIDEVVRRMLGLASSIRTTAEAMEPEA